jgi:hypothetical protein
MNRALKVLFICCAIVVKIALRFGHGALGPGWGVDDAGMHTCTQQQRMSINISRGIGNSSTSGMRYGNSSVIRPSSSSLLLQLESFKASFILATWPIPAQLYRHTHAIAHPSQAKPHFNNKHTPTIRRANRIEMSVETPRSVLQYVGGWKLGSTLGRGGFGKS